MRVTLLLVLVLALQGCAFFQKRAPSIPPSTVVTIDKAALEQCSLLKEDLVVVTFEDALLVYGELATAYGTCATKQATSVKLLKQFGNIK